MKPRISLRAALADKNLFAPILGGESWLAWRVLLIAAMGEALTDEERAIFTRLTQRQKEPLERIETLVAIAPGRRGGKSRSTAVLATYIAALCSHKGTVVAGEKPLVLCLAQNQRQAKVVYHYIIGIFDTCPMLGKLIWSQTADTLTLTNGIAIEVRAASFRGLSGITAVAVLADESCFWRTDETSLNADSEILDAVRPCLATTGGPLILTSSPYARRGETWELYNKNFGPDGDPLTLVAQGASRDFNPSLSQRIVDRALEVDPIAASAEYLGQWRTDIESFVRRECVEACVAHGVFERPYLPGYRYYAFTDPSGGSSDSMTLAVAHKERKDEQEVSVVDAIREVRPPFSPEAVVGQFVSVLRSYRVRQVCGDKYASEWPRERFRVWGVDYKTSERSKSEIYTELLPLVNGNRVALLDEPKIISQLIGLERKTARSGKDSIDHGPNAHDDCINAVAGAVVTAVANLNAYTVQPLRI